MMNDLYLGDGATGHTEPLWRVTAFLLGSMLVFFVPYWVVFVFVAVVFMVFRTYELLVLLPVVDALIAVPYGPFMTPLWGTIVMCLLLAAQTLRRL